MWAAFVVQVGTGKFLVFHYISPLGEAINSIQYNKA